MRITQRQIDIVYLMQNGYIMLVGVSETSGRSYYLVTKGKHNEYFNMGTFARLLENDLIYQQNSFPFDYILTKRGAELVIKKPNLI